MISIDETVVLGRGSLMTQLQDKRQGYTFGGVAGSGLPVV